MAASLLPFAEDGERLARFAQPFAHADRLITEGERFWRFRPYQGGENAFSIDWKQSARVDKLLVREREKSREPLLLFWRGFDGPVASRLVLALAYLALDNGARVGWLGEASPLKGRAMFHAFADRAPEKTRLPPEASVCAQAKILFTVEQSCEEPSLWKERFACFQAQRARGTLFDLGEKSAGLTDLVRANGWPVVRPAKREEETLLLLFEAILQ